MIGASAASREEVTQRIAPEDAESCALTAARRDAREAADGVLALLRHAQEHPECYERPGARVETLSAARDTLEVALGFLGEVPE